MPADDVDGVIAYHQATKHHFHAYAAGPGYLDWETQPDPFRRYDGAPVISLDLVPRDEGPPYAAAFSPGTITPAPLNRRTISQLFLDSLALSAWKSTGTSTWALRVNPSSGNLHPTEGYLVCGSIEGLTDTPMVCHYAPHEHALEQRAILPHENWLELMSGMPPTCVLVGLTSILWREAWKYGERAFRYCNHDVGHAIAAISIAAAGLGWRATLLDGAGASQLAALFGVFDQHGPEAEHPDGVLAVYPAGETCRSLSLPAGVVETFPRLVWQGSPNRLSPDHVDWGLDHVAAAAHKPATPNLAPATTPAHAPTGTTGELPADRPPIPLRRIVHQRRSAVAMDGETTIGRETLFGMLARCMPDNRPPFDALWWQPRIHLALFVHRVEGVPPGLYLLARDPAQVVPLRKAMRREFDWATLDACPPSLPLYRLAAADVRQVSMQVSCHQEIASDGCFSLGMIAEFEQPLREHGAWFYPRLFWEAGAVGQVLYLEAEAAGIRGTGIGCYFDDPVHNVLGLTGVEYQSLYHFTTGGPLEDRRLMTWPPYRDRVGM